MLGGEPQGLVLPPHVFAEVTQQDGNCDATKSSVRSLPSFRLRDEAATRWLSPIDTDYGLAGAVFTRDMERGMQFAEANAGGHGARQRSAGDRPADRPFGGEKNSGIGRFNGTWAIEAFTTDQWVSVQHTARRYPWNARAVQGPWA